MTKLWKLFLTKVNALYENIATGFGVGIACSLFLVPLFPIGIALQGLWPLTTAFMVATFAVYMWRTSWLTAGMAAVGFVLYVAGWPIAYGYHPLAGQAVCGIGILVFFGGVSLAINRRPPAVLTFFAARA